MGGGNEGLVELVDGIVQTALDGADRDAPNVRRLSIRLVTTIVLIALGILIILLPSLLRRQRPGL